jgi:hypothetical protein
VKITIQVNVELEFRLEADNHDQAEQIASELAGQVRNKLAAFSGDHNGRSLYPKLNVAGGVSFVEFNW